MAALRLLALVLLGLLAGCAEQASVPELLTLTELLPRRLSSGDRVEIRGINLPASEVGHARVVFRGDIHRPGQVAVRGVEIAVDGAKLDRDRVTFEAGDALVERFTGRGDEARHATFRGVVEVWLPSASRGLPVHGSIKGTTVLDVEPRPPRRAVLDELAAEASAAAQFLGVALSPAPGGAGVRVDTVRDGSPAARAGLRPGDVVDGFDGVGVVEPSHVLPTGHDRKVALSLWRDGARHEVAIDLTGFRGDASRELVGAVVVLGALLALMLLVGSSAGRGVTWIAHRIGRALAPQGRRARGWLGIVLPPGDAASDRPGVRLLAAVTGAVGGTALFAAVALVELTERAELDLAVLYLASLTAFTTIALLTGGWARGAPSFGERLQAVAAVVLCELPAACALGAAIAAAGSMRLRDLVLAQAGAQGSFAETGGFPWYWSAAKSPHLAVLFASFFVVALVDGRADPSAASRGRPSGASTLRRAAFLVATWGNVAVMCALGAAVFLGGWFVPGYSAYEHRQSGWLLAAGVGLFVAKGWLLAASALLLRAALPRVGVGSVLRAGARILVPVTIAGVGLAVVTTLYPPLPTVERALALLVLAVAVAAAAVVALGVRADLALRRAATRAKPYRVNTLL